MNKVLDKIETYGYLIPTITFNDKFDIIEKLYEFKRETIDGSMIRNELYLIDETKGIHWASSGWRICDLEPVYRLVERFNGYIFVKEERFAGYKTITNKSLEEYVEYHKDECEKWIEEHIGLDKYKEQIEKLVNKRKDNSYHYYQLESKDRGYVLEYYTENNHSNGYASIASTRHGFNIEFDGIILGDEKESPLQSILMFMLLNKDMFKDFRELDKGFVFNNHYYESVDDIVEDIEYCIKNKKLHEKFMNEGLSSEDLKQ